jgi:F-type H+-transporting ATPase subunit b
MSLIFAASSGGGGILNFNSGFAIWVVITLVIFLFVMSKYVVPLILKSLDEREQNIKNSLEAAEKAIAKAERISEDNRKALKEAEIKAQKIRKEAIEEAELLRSERIEKAKKDASKLLEDARKTIEQEKKQALSELRNEVAELAVKSASMIIGEELDRDKNKKLVDDFIGDLSKN